jgi:hypothetical protein
MIITVHIDRWDVTRILIDNDSQAEILPSSLQKNGLYGFSGKRIEPIEVITLPVSFSTPQNPRTKYVTFDVVDMLYPYDAIFGRGLLNTFEATLYSGYLCLTFLATFRVISIFNSQKDAENIEWGFMPDNKNLHFL